MAGIREFHHDGKTIKAVRFNIPFKEYSDYHTRILPEGPPNGPAGRRRIKRPNGGYKVIHGESWEFDRGEIDLLLNFSRSPLNYDPDDLIVAGIFSFEELAARGLYGDVDPETGDPNDERKSKVEKLNARLETEGLPKISLTGEKQKAPVVKKSDPALGVPPPDLPPLPVFDNMDRSQLITWATEEENPERFGPTIKFNLSSSKQRIIDTIRAELRKRGDPRITY